MSHPWYRTERWLLVELAAFVPLVISFFLPSRWRLPLVGLAAGLVIIGLVMLARRGPDAAERSDVASS